MKRTMVLAIAILALSAGTALAALPSSSDYPNPAKMPTITGTIASVSDYEVLVNTDDGHQISMQMDSRTLVPPDLASGMPAQVDFRLMENGEHYATRIVPIRTGAREDRTAYREEAEPASYEARENQQDELVAQNMSTTPRTDADDKTNTRTNVNTTRTTTGTTSTSTTTGTLDNNTQDNMNSGTTNDKGALPKTASNQPLVALFGTLALAAAIAIRELRRRSRV